jgi:hypothetical protein
VVALLATDGSDPLVEVGEAPEPPTAALSLVGLGRNDHDFDHDDPDVSGVAVGPGNAVLQIDRDNSLTNNQTGDAK